MKDRREAVALRKELGRLEHRGRGHRYPLELRERVVAYLDARRAEGVTVQAVGDELGMDWRTLGRWLPA